MKKLFTPLLMFAVCLWAADIWQSKPYTEWSEKDAQKLMTSSPWAKSVQVAMSSGGGGRGRGKGASTDGSVTGDMSGPASGGGMGGGKGGGRSMADDNGVTGVPSIEMVVRWQTALPVREAMVVAKYGSESGTSPEAKKFLEQPVNVYAVAVSGPIAMSRLAERKDDLLSSTSILVRGKDPVKANDIITSGDRTVIFIFPRTSPITVDDKDVEFETKIGRNQLRCKFHLKDMMFNGKLEM